MNTKQIDCVIELCNTLNFSQAAENLFISQPSLSYQIKELETEIGFRIFERSGKGAALTPAGEQFCLNLRRIKDDIIAAIEQGQNVGSKYSESLNVCLPLRACLYYLPEIMQRFEREMPFDCEETLNCGFGYRTNDKRESTKRFIEITKAFYKNSFNIPL